MQTQLTILAAKMQSLASDIRALKCEAQDRDLPDLFGMIEDAEDAADEANRKLCEAARSLAIDEEAA